MVKADGEGINFWTLVQGKNFFLANVFAPETLDNSLFSAVNYLLALSGSRAHRLTHFKGMRESSYKSYRLIFSAKGSEIVQLPVAESLGQIRSGNE